MLVVRRNEGQCVRITHHATGETVVFRLYRFRYRNGRPTSALMAFDDPSKRFGIERLDDLPKVAVVDRFTVAE